MATVILFVLALFGLTVVKLQQGDNPKIPPATSPNGWMTRIVLWSFLIIGLSYFVYTAVLGGRYTIGVTVTTVLIVAVLSFRYWGKGSRK